jgi:F-type H+-transporting ATPase subunit delta
VLRSKIRETDAMALIKWAEEENQLYTVLEDIRLIDETIHDSRELVLFLRSKLIKPDRKQAVMQELFENKVSTYTLEFLKLVVEKNREDLLPDIVRSFSEQYNKQAGIIDVEVVSADELQEAQVEALKSALEKQTGKQVQLIFKTQPDLLGGLTVKIEDTVIDGSIKHKLQELDALLHEAHV